MHVCREHCALVLRGRLECGDWESDGHRNAQSFEWTGNSQKESMYHVLSVDFAAIWKGLCDLMACSAVLCFVVRAGSAWSGSDKI